MADESGADRSDIRRAWSANAEFWDEFMGDDGVGTWQAEMIAPAVDVLLGDVDGLLLLELACGNGQYSRHLADRGARVIAGDLSPAMVERARNRSSSYGEHTEFIVLDACDARAVGALGHARFDAAVCNMAIMDMDAVAPMFEGVAAVLRAGAPLVVSTLHPCFNTAGVVLVEEVIEEPGERLRREYSLKLSRYKSSVSWRGEAVSGQPELHPYVHRPLEEILGAAFAAGLSMDGLREPVLPEPEGNGRVSWDRLRDIPPVMVMRFRTR